LALRQLSARKYRHPLKCAKFPVSSKYVAFICGPDDPTTVALKKAAESGSAQDIKKAHTLFLKLKPGHRQAALSMLQTD